MSILGCSLCYEALHLEVGLDRWTQHLCLYSISHVMGILLKAQIRQMLNTFGRLLVGLEAALSSGVLCQARGASDTGTKCPVPPTEPDREEGTRGSTVVETLRVICQIFSRHSEYGE